MSSLSFLKERSSDENMYAPCVIETLSLLGTLMKFESEPLRQQIAHALTNFYTAESNKAQAEGNTTGTIYRSPHMCLSSFPGLQATAVTYNAALVERSGVARFIAEVSNN